MAEIPGFTGAKSPFLKIRKPLSIIFLIINALWLLDSCLPVLATIPGSLQGMLFIDVFLMDIKIFAYNSFYILLSAATFSSYISIVSNKRKSIEKVLYYASLMAFLPSLISINDVKNTPLGMNILTVSNIFNIGDIFKAFVMIALLFFTISLIKLKRKLMLTSIILFVFTQLCQIVLEYTFFIQNSINYDIASLIFALITQLLFVALPLFGLYMNFGFFIESKARISKKEGTVLDFLRMAIFKKYDVFMGRSRREEFWTLFIFDITTIVYINIISLVVDFRIAIIFHVLSYIFIASIFLPSIAVCVRRLHDINKSGVWLLILLIPIIGIIAFFIFMGTPGVTGVNSFGEDPEADPPIFSKL